MADEQMNQSSVYDATVAALAEVINTARLTWRGGPDEAYDDLIARAVLASDVIADLIAEAVEAERIRRVMTYEAGADDRETEILALLEDETTVEAIWIGDAEDEWLPRSDIAHVLAALRALIGMPEATP